MENKSVREYAEAIKKLGYKVAISYKEDFGICGNDKGSSSFRFNEYGYMKTFFEFCFTSKEYTYDHGEEIRIENPSDITKEIVERSFHAPYWTRNHMPHANYIPMPFNEALERLSFKTL